MSIIKNEKIGIIGSGLIGRSWAMLFAAAGYNVTVFDIEPKQVQEALSIILSQLRELEKSGLLRGELTVDQQHALITGTDSLQQCVTGAKYIQECVPERLDLKLSVFSQLDKLCDDKVTLASSTSSMPASKFTADLKHRSQCIVVHPVNPPFVTPLVEVSPAPWTHPDNVSATRALMTEIGQSPVLLKKEVLGFAVNRIQYAILNECWRLVNDDVLSVEDVDKVMKDGLGRRYAFIGPFETAHLNANGFQGWCESYVEMLSGLAESFNVPSPKWEGATFERIGRKLEEMSPLAKLDERRQWRDARLAGLAKLKNTDSV